MEVQEGEEGEAFWSMMGGRGTVSVRLPAYDEDYGVGKSPTLPPPEVTVSLPLDRSGGQGEAAHRLLPGVHTTSAGPPPLPTPRGEPPSRSLGLGGNSLSMPAGLPDEPLPTPRGRPEGLGGEPSGKKAREDESEAAASDNAEPKAELFAYPDWEDLSMFDRDDLLPDGVFALLCYAADGKTPEKVMLWVGEESELVSERDSDLMEVVAEFTAERELGEIAAEIVHESEEPDAFWEYFVNG